MNEQDHGLHVESVPRRPGADRPPVSRAAAPSVPEQLHNLDPEALRSVAELLTGQHEHSPIVRAAIQSAAEAGDDTEAGRAGAT